MEARRVRRRGSVFRKVTPTLRERPLTTVPFGPVKRSMAQGNLPVTLCIALISRRAGRLLLRFLDVCRCECPFALRHWQQRRIELHKRGIDRAMR